MKLQKQIARRMVTISLVMMVCAGAISAAIRICGGRETPGSVLGYGILPACIGGGLMVLPGIRLARRAAKRITEPILHIDPEEPENSCVYEELEPLMERIRGQSEELQSRMQEMEKRHQQEDARRREFTANVSHELKTPLTAISGYAELISTGIAKPEDVGRFAGKIHDEAHRLSTLVGDIIMLSKLDSKELNLPCEKLDLYETASAVLDHLRMAAQEKQVTFSLEGEHLTVTAPEQIAEAVVYNLCDNAVKYNRPGGKVAVTLRQCVDGVELTVQDTGIGIGEADTKRIFERFFRADKSHSREVGGTGLGLSIVKHCAMYLNASVSVESTLGEGSTFRVLF